MDLLELELGWSSRRQTGWKLEKERPGIKKEIRTGATTHVPMQLGGGGGRWVKQSAIVNEWSGLHVVPCSTVRWSGSQAAHCTKCGIACSRLVGSIGKGDGPLKRPGDRGSLKPKSCPGWQLGGKGRGPNWPE